MMKWTMNAKELKEMIEKAMTAINKKSPVPSLSRIYLKVDENKIVKMWGTNMNHYAEVRSENAYYTEPGIIGIDADDTKIITKMSGEITLEDITEGNDIVGKLNVKCGKKTVTIPRYIDEDIFVPVMDTASETKVLTLKENWLLETIVNLDAYTAHDNVNKMLNLFNFNTKYSRIEACDSHRIGMRTLKSSSIHETTENSFDTVKIHNMCVPVFKKLMDKKSKDEITIYQDKKYIKVEGKDFTYITRRVDSQYFDIEKIISCNSDFQFVPNREKILEVMKYNADLVKTSKLDKNPVILHSENGQLYSYIDVKRYESFDEIEATENNMKDDLYIGLNPQFLADAFGIVDSDKPLCMGKNEKCPIIIYGKEYSFMVLPVFITTADYIPVFKKKLGIEVA